MTLPVVFPDSTALAIDYLRGELADRWPGAVLGAKVPDTLPPVFVQVVRTGGVAGTVTEDARLTLDVWAGTPEDSHDLAQLCRALLHAVPYMRPPAIDGVPVLAVADFGTPVPLPDPQSGQPRHEFTVQLTVRGAALS